MRGGAAAVNAAKNRAKQPVRPKDKESKASQKYVHREDLDPDGDVSRSSKKLISQESKRSKFVSDAILSSSFGKHLLKVDNARTAITENQRSFWIFSRTGFVRRHVCTLVKYPWFDKMVLTLIVLNCGFLAADDPLCDEECAKNSARSQVLKYAEYFFTAAFTLEVSLQSVAKGFIFGHGAYLHSAWSWLDLVSVVTAYSFLIPGLGNVSGLRAFRALRPLRTISGVPGMRVLVNTLIDSVPLMLDVMVLITWMFFVFGIVGMQMFMGSLRGRCYEVNDVGGLGDVVEGMENTVCALASMGGQRGCPANSTCEEAFTGFHPAATNPNPNYGYTSFDNFLWACLNIMHALTLQGWTTDQMYLMYDGAGVISIIYFILLVLFGAFFALNLLTAIISVKFAQSDAAQKAEQATDEAEEAAALEAKEEEMKAEALEKRREAMKGGLEGIGDAGGSLNRSRRRLTGHVTKVAERAGKGYRSLTRSVTRTPWVKRPRKKVKELVGTDRFANFITGCILINTGMMAIEHHNMNTSLADVLEMMNYVLSAIFLVEMLMKHVAFGVYGYWKSPFNVLDGFIVIVSVVEVGAGGANSGLSALRTFRLLRVLRSMKLLRQFAGLRKLMVMVLKGFVALKDFMMLLFLFIFIFAILGMQIFGGKPEFSKDETIFYRKNFNSLWEAIYTVFEILTGANWFQIMWNGMKSEGPAASLYFVAWIIVGHFVLLTLFLAILITNFQDAGEGDDEDGDQMSSSESETSESGSDLTDFLDPDDDGVAAAEAPNGEEEEEEEEEEDPAAKAKAKEEEDRKKKAAVAAGGHNGIMGMLEGATASANNADHVADVEKIITWLVSIGEHYGIEEDILREEEAKLAKADLERIKKVERRGSYKQKQGISQFDGKVHSFVRTTSDVESSRQSAGGASVSQMSTPRQPSMPGTPEEPESGSQNRDSQPGTPSLRRAMSSQDMRSISTDDLRGLKPLEGGGGTGGGSGRVLKLTENSVKQLQVELAKETEGRPREPSLAMGIPNVDPAVEDWVPHPTFAASRGNQVAPLPFAIDAAETKRRSGDYGGAAAGGCSNGSAPPPLESVTLTTGGGAGAFRGTDLVMPNGDASPAAATNGDRTPARASPFTGPSPNGHGPGGGGGGSDPRAPFPSAELMLARPPGSGSGAADDEEDEARPPVPGASDPGHGQGYHGMSSADARGVAAAVEEGVGRRGDEAGAPPPLEAADPGGGGDVMGSDMPDRPRESRASIESTSAITFSEAKPGEGARLEGAGEGLSNGRPGGSENTAASRGGAGGDTGPSSAPAALLGGGVAEGVVGEGPGAGGMGPPAAPAPPPAPPEPHGGVGWGYLGPGPTRPPWGRGGGSAVHPEGMQIVPYTGGVGAADRTDPFGGDFAYEPQRRALVRRFPHLVWSRRERALRRAAERVVSGGWAAEGGVGGVGGGGEAGPVAEATGGAGAVAHVVTAAGAEARRAAQEARRGQRRKDKDRKKHTNARKRYKKDRDHARKTGRPERPFSDYWPLPEMIERAKREAEEKAEEEREKKDEEVRKADAQRQEEEEKSRVAAMSSEERLHEEADEAAPTFEKDAKAAADAAAEAEAEETRKRREPPSTREQLETAAKHKSFWFLSAENPVRKVAIRICVSKSFEYTILFLIMVNSILLALDGPRLCDPCTIRTVFDETDRVFTIAFTIEMCSKIIAMGFALHEASYLRSSWNILDFIIVSTSLMDLFMNNSSLQILRPLRLMRALRPLRMISRLKGMQIVVQALIGSLPQVLNVVAFGVFEFGVFGILGVQLFGGKFYRCNDLVNDDLIDPATNTTGLVVSRIGECTEGMFLCQEGDLCEVGLMTERRWDTTYLNFDHVGNAMLALFVVATLDDWMVVAYECMDATGVDKVPEENKQPYMAIYVFLFVFLGSLFWVNLLVGVIIDHYTTLAKEYEEGSLMTDDQKAWMDALKLKGYQNREADKANAPAHPIRRKCYLLVYNPRFELTIMGCIMGNVLGMALQFYGQSSAYTLFLDILNYIFTAVFTCEAVLKITAMLWKKYWSDPWNRFDLMIVVVSIPDLFLNIGVGATVFRIFRIGRMFKLVQNAKGLRTLFNTLLTSLPAIVNVGSLLFLLMFVFGVMGMTLFGESDPVEAFNVDRHANFQNFGYSLTTLFRVFTGDSWSAIMKDAAGCDKYHGGCSESPVPAFYFISFVVIGSFVMLNLIIAVILDKFIESAADEGLLKSDNFFDLLRRKMILDRFVERLKRKVRDYQTDGRKEADRARLANTSGTSVKNITSRLRGQASKVSSATSSSVLKAGRSLKKLSSFASHESRVTPREGRSGNTSPVVSQAWSEQNRLDGGKAAVDRSLSMPTKVGVSSNNAVDAVMQRQLAAAEAAEEAAIRAGGGDAGSASVGGVSVGGEGKNKDSLFFFGGRRRSGPKPEDAGNLTIS